MVLIFSGCGILVAVPPQSAWLDVPFVKQQKDACGAASIAMIMQYWQQQRRQSLTPNAEYQRIQEALLSPAAHGILASDMERYFQQNGFTTYSFTGDLDILGHHLEKGRPLIVALKPGVHLPLHYVVVAGVDPEQSVILLNDPAQRKLLKMEYSSFERQWKGAGHWTLLAVPAGSTR